MIDHQKQWKQEARQVLERHLDRLCLLLEPHSPNGPVVTEQIDMAAGPLETLVRKFSLSPFERDILLACAGVEYDPGFARLFAGLHGTARMARPTFSLLHKRLQAPHWDAIAPNSPLRRGRLIQVGEGPGLANSPLRLEEPVLHYLTGLPQMDQRLGSLMRPVALQRELSANEQRNADRLAKIWYKTPRHLARLATADASLARGVFASACKTIGFTPYTLDANLLGRTSAEVDDLASLWERDAVLNDLCLLVDVTSANAETHRTTGWFADRLHVLTAIVGEGEVPTPLVPQVRMDLHPASTAEQIGIWENALGPRFGQLNGQVGRLVQQFSLSARDIVESVQQAELDGVRDPVQIGRALWRACRQHARGGMDDLAQRIDIRARWEDLVLPAAQIQLLHQIAMQLRQRHRVYETWGFGRKSSRGMGVSALFWGPSGTGKTMAAEVLANELELDLFRIDLSVIVSKYIGETEKNLRRIFDTAETSGAILLFDEADALFGKRSEVKDSHDRYANLEVSYLLQRMESYRGCAVLTTNLKSSLDHAFLRRLRFIIPFPFPGPAERQAIWRKVFPEVTPRGDLDYKKLAQLSVTGGSIANIALDAAFRAAEEGTPVSMQHLLQATKADCGKVEKPLSDIEIKGWV